MSVITVDCTDAESIKNELLIYVSDQVGAIPALKIRQFVLSSIDDEEIDKLEVITAIKEFLDSIGEGRSFAVISSENTISIKSLSGKKIERDPPAPSQMFTCSHCGFVSQYEVELNNHLKMHYL